MTTRKVVCVYGKFDDKSDFVLEPACPDCYKCKECKDAFWIEDRSSLSKFVWYGMLAAAITSLIYIASMIILVWLS